MIKACNFKRIYTDTNHGLVLNLYVINSLGDQCNINLFSSQCCNFNSSFLASLKYLQLQTEYVSKYIWANALLPFKRVSMSSRFILNKVFNSLFYYVNDNSFSSPVTLQTRLFHKYYETWNSFLIRSLINLYFQCSCTLHTNHSWRVHVLLISHSLYVVFNRRIARKVKDKSYWNVKDKPARHPFILNTICFQIYVKL